MQNKNILEVWEWDAGRRSDKRSIKVEQRGYCVSKVFKNTQNDVGLRAFK